MPPVTIPNQAMVTFDMEEINRISIGLLQSLELNGVTVGEGAAGLALSLSRIMAPHPLEQDEEIDFVQNLIQWIGAYYASGGLN